MHGGGERMFRRELMIDVYAGGAEFADEGLAVRFFQRGVA
jgi:hypothetical protein